ncbi:MAG: DegT/DnrJ/EryC1/StrS family aminotransferase [Methanomassiliicoccus sp.]|nr:DegT/DnrJ/EryC1/StrS family aminotransferase [Methanomassiliicoccus sp.]
MNKIPVSRPTVTDEMVAAMADAVRNERMVLGESVFRFEEEFARYIGTKHAISVSSGTDALILTMMALNVRGREVITTPLSFIATANAIVHAGATPIFADASLKDYNIEPSEVRPGRDTAAVMPVHLFGYPARMDEIRENAGERVKIVEDACQAHGAVYKGRKVGALGDAGCFSFYATKNMTVGGDGGMITTSDDRLAADLRKLRDCGRVSRYEHDVFGFTARLNTANAAFGRVQLRHLDGWNERRRAIARRYAERLKDVEEIVLPPTGSRDVVPVFHLFVIQAEDRDALARTLLERNIEALVHYPIPIHLQPVYRDALGMSEGSYPDSERLAGRVLSLPIFPTLTDEEVDWVCQAIVEHYGGKA